MPLTAAGKAAQQYNRTQTIDPEALCILGGIPRHDASGLPFEVLQTQKRVAFLTHPFEFNRTWVLGKPGEGLTEYCCAENNVDAKHLGPGPGVIGADGNRGADLPTTMPANPPPPEYYENKK